MNRNSDPRDPFSPIRPGRERYCSRRAEFDSVDDVRGRRCGTRLFIACIVLAAIVWTVVFFYGTSRGAPAPDLTAAGLTPLTDTGGVDGRHYVTYRTAPNAPRPTTAPAAPGYEVWADTQAVAGARYAVTLRELPGTPSGPAPASQPTTQPHRTAYPNGVYSVNHTAAQVVRDAYIKSCPRNIVCQNFKGNLLLDNVVSVDALGPAQFDCQGAYFDEIEGVTTIQNCYFGYNGRSRLAPGATPTQYYHHIYFNSSAGKAGPLRVLGCILAKSGADAIETRTLRGSEVAGNVFLDCGVALQCVMGGANVHDNLIYGGEYFWDGGGWTGNTALRGYWQLVCNNNIILSRPGQGAPPASAAHPARAVWPQYGINLGGEWKHSNPAWTPPPGYPAVATYMSGSGNLISPGWPAPAQFPGALWYSSGTAEKQKMSGWAVGRDGPAYDYAPLLQQIEDEKIGIPAAIARIRADLLGHS